MFNKKNIVNFFETMTDDVFVGGRRGGAWCPENDEKLPGGGVKNSVFVDGVISGWSHQNQTRNF